MIIWTDYFIYRTKLRGFKLETLEAIIRLSSERYFDTETQRFITIGRHEHRLVAIVCEYDNEDVTPITVHATSQQQVRFRLRTGRYISE